MISWYISSSFITPSRTPSRGLMFHCVLFHCVSEGHVSGDAEELLRVPDPVRKGVDLGVRVVEVEAGPVGCLAAEGAVQRPRAVVPGPDRDAKLVKHLADVVRVHALNVERYRAAAVLGGKWAEDAQAGDLAQCLKGVGGERLLVRGHIVE